jgi:hypothetical protein
MSTRISTTIRTVPNIPAGYGPHAALYGQLGKAPINSTTRMIRRIVPSGMFVPPNDAK